MKYAFTLDWFGSKLCYFFPGLRIERIIRWKNNVSIVYRWVAEIWRSKSFSSKMMPFIFRGKSQKVKIFNPPWPRYLLFNLKLRGTKMFRRWNHCINQLNDDLLNFKNGKGASCKVEERKKRLLVEWAGKKEKKRKTPIICTLYSLRYPHLQHCR